jgi:hypothetical protein
MNKIILLVFILLSASVYAETYKWIDKNGTTHFGDYPPPDDQKNYEKIKSGRPVQEQTLKNSSPSDLTQEDLHFIDILKERGIITYEESLEKPTHEQLMRYKEITGINLNSLEKPPDPRFSSPEKTFQLYRESLIKGDLELAINCFTPHQAKNQKEVLNALGKDVMKKIGEDMQPIQKIRQDDKMAEYEIIRDENGKKMSYAIYFVNIFGNWKIDQF